MFLNLLVKYISWYLSFHLICIWCSELVETIHEVQSKSSRNLFQCVYRTKMWFNKDSFRFSKLYKWKVKRSKNLQLFTKIWTYKPIFLQNTYTSCNHTLAPTIIQLFKTLVKLISEMSFSNLSHFLWHPQRPQNSCASVWTSRLTKRAHHW